MPYNDLPGRSLRIAWRDGAVLRAFADERGMTIKDAINELAALLIFGGTVKANPRYRPDGWEYRHGAGTDE